MSQYVPEEKAKEDWLEIYTDWKDDFSTLEIIAVGEVGGKTIKAAKAVKVKPPQDSV